MLAMVRAETLRPEISKIQANTAHGNERAFMRVSNHKNAKRRIRIDRMPNQAQHRLHEKTIATQHSRL